MGELLVNLIIWIVKAHFYFDYVFHIMILWSIFFNTEIYQAVHPVFMILTACLTLFLHYKLNQVKIRGFKIFQLTSNIIFAIFIIVYGPDAIWGWFLAIIYLLISWFVRKPYEPVEKVYNTKQVVATQQSDQMQYSVKDSMLTDYEKNFFTNTLKPMVEKYDIHINIKASLKEYADVTISKQDNFSAFQSNFNKITQKHFDFVICDSTTLAPILAIELDDKSHNTDKAQKNDNFKNEFCKTIGLDLIRFSDSTGHKHITNKTYDCPNCSTKIETSIKKDTGIWLYCPNFRKCGLKPTEFIHQLVSHQLQTLQSATF